MRGQSCLKAVVRVHVRFRLAVTCRRAGIGEQHEFGLANRHSCRLAGWAGIDVTLGWPGARDGPGAGGQGRVGAAWA